MSPAKGHSQYKKRSASKKHPVAKKYQTSSAHTQKLHKKRANSLKTLSASRNQLETFQDP